MSRDRRTQNGGVIGHAVALGAEFMDIHPVRHRRQCRDVSRWERGRGIERSLGMTQSDALLPTIVADFQSQGKAVDDVMVCRSEHRRRAGVKPRHSGARDVFQRNFRVGIGGVSAHERRIADSFQLEISTVKLFDLAGGDLHGDRRIAHLDTHERQPGFLRVNRGDALPLEPRIHQQKLPSGRGALRDDAVVSARNDKIARLIADIFQAGTGRPDLHVHMREGGMLRDMESHRDRGAVTLLQLDVDVAHPAVERELARIDEWLAGFGSVIGEVEKVLAGPFLKSRRVPVQHKHRSLRTVANQPDALPNMDGPAQAVPALRNEHNASVGGFLDAIDGRLQR